MSGIDLEFVRAIVAILNDSSVREISVRRGDLSVRARRAEPPPGAFPAPAAATAPYASPETEVHRATADWVGLFHTRESGARKALASAGAEVEAGQLLGYIESVKLWNEVVAPCAGTVVRILAADGQPVGYGDPLFDLEPSDSGTPEVR